MLAAAGYPAGFEMELEWAEFQGWTFNEFVQIVARYFGDIGVRVKLKQLETSTWLNKAGGIAGRQIELAVEDTKYDVPTTIAAYDALGWDGYHLGDDSDGGVRKLPLLE